jgi:7-cyano-7-deazaguanine synthase
VTVVHNGLVANDKEFEIHPHAIDSSVLAPLFFKEQVDGSVGELREIMKKVLGSYAIGMFNKKFSGNLYLATNYKPIYYVRYPVGIMFFQLEDFYYKGLGCDTHYRYNHIHPLVRIEPYTVAVVGKNALVETAPLLDPPTSAKALVVCSSGLDSTTVASYAQKIDGKDITLVHFKYHCLAEKKEVESIQRIAEYLKCPVTFVETDFFSNLGGSTLFGKEEGITQLDKGVEWAYEWCPARNLIMMSLAIGMAERHDVPAIYLGNNLEEGGAYPDNEQEFIHLLNKVIPYAVNNGKQIKIYMPVGNLMKHEIVKLGMQLDPQLFQYQWSCYLSRDRHCGKCGPCCLRRKAFEMNGMVDPVPYEV